MEGSGQGASGDFLWSVLTRNSCPASSPGGPWKSSRAVLLQEYKYTSDLSVLRTVESLACHLFRVLFRHTGAEPGVLSSCCVITHYTAQLFIYGSQSFIFWLLDLPLAVRLQLRKTKQGPAVALP